MSSTAPANSGATPRIVITPGDPAGIGPDLAVMLAGRALPAAVAAIADPALLAERCAALGRRLRIVELDSAAAARATPAGVLQVVPVATAVPVRPGRADPRNAAYVLSCLDRALAACRSGDAAGMVTGPVNKAVINDGGVAFSGHTEYLAAALDAPLPVMLLVADTLRVALLTTHVPLRQVPDLVTRERVLQVTQILHRDLVSRFGLVAPRIALLGLNPHAGEGGHLGREELEVLAPAVAALRERGMDVHGPLPGDTAFNAGQRQSFDAFLACYHDQGLAPLKALSFGAAVNVTLGLPLLRTSVDHGTAFELAGSGRADPASLEAALELAITLAGRTSRAA